MTAWKVLIVDDEEGIHGITRMIFRGYEFEGQPIELISATSSEQAQALLQAQPDIALALLDVVMEQDNTGLLLVDYIRTQLGNQDMRIILRTGHPGYAPEAQVIVNYDINDYLSKAELSASRLLTSVVVALRSYRDIKSARQHQPKQQSTAPETQPSVLPALAEHLHKLNQPLQQNSQRLVQMELNPVAHDLCNQLKQQIDRLSFSLGMLQQTTSAAVPERFDIGTLLDQILSAFLPQSRQEGWLLDYQLQLSQRQLFIDKQALQQLLHCAIEIALLQANDNDLKLLFSEAPQQHGETLLEIKLQQRTGTPSPLNQAWLSHLNQQFTQLFSRLCQQQESQREKSQQRAGQQPTGVLLEPEGTTLIHCLLPAFADNQL